MAIRRAVMGRKTVGILGGMGPAATHAFLGHVIRLTRAKRDQDHLHVVVDSDPGIPDRTDFIVGEGPDPRPALIAAARRLAAAGCELIAVPCNTANAFLADMASAVDVHFFDWVAIAAEVAAARGKRVGLLATSGTVTSGIYERALVPFNATVVLPGASAQASMMEAVYGAAGVKSGRAGGLAQSQLLAAAHDVQVRGADVILLGCTELPLALSSTDGRWPLPTIDPSPFVARRLVTEAGGSVDVDAASELGVGSGEGMGRRGALDILGRE